MGIWVHHQKDRHWIYSIPVIWPLVFALAALALFVVAALVRIATA